MTATGKPTVADALRGDVPQAAEPKKQTHNEARAKARLAQGPAEELSTMPVEALKAYIRARYWERQDADRRMNEAIRALMQRVAPPKREVTIMKFDMQGRPIGG